MHSQNVFEEIVCVRPPPNPNLLFMPIVGDDARITSFLNSAFEEGVAEHHMITMARMPLVASGSVRKEGQTMRIPVVPVRKGTQFPTHYFLPGIFSLPPPSSQHI